MKPEHSAKEQLLIPIDLEREDQLKKILFSLEQLHALQIAHGNRIGHIEGHIEGQKTALQVIGVLIALGSLIWALKR